VEWSNRVMKATWCGLIVSSALTGCFFSSDHDIFVGEPWEEQPLRPAFGAPISGGNLLVTRDGRFAVVADPDRDRLVTVDLRNDNVVEIPLTEKDEPGRLVEDGAGRVHVAMRRSNVVVTLDTGFSKAEMRRTACSEPRGIAWEEATDSIHIACASGELATLPAAGGEATRMLHLDRDLRDVLVLDNKLVVTLFRSAELLVVTSKGEVTLRQKPPTTHRLVFSSEPTPAPPPGGGGSGRADAVPEVAWRTIALPSGGYLMSHQRAIQAPLSTKPGGYGGGCGDGAVESALSILGPGRQPFAVAPILRGALPVDVAVSKSNLFVAVALAGKPGVQVQATSALAFPDDLECGLSAPVVPMELSSRFGAPTSVQFAPTGALLISYPETSTLVIRTGAAFENERGISLKPDNRVDAGKNVFHKQTFSGLACASCHPEGREDGQVWDFAGLGKRRTQSLAGNITRRGPYHWEGDMKDLSMLMDEVFSGRMAGGQLSSLEKRSLGPWLDSIAQPAPKPAKNAEVAAAVTRGKALFESPQVACVGCHTGELMTNNVRFDVGTAGTFKVPSLVGVGARAPFLHNGCAATLRARFDGSCGGGDFHGRTSQLTGAQLDDLTAYMDSL
jgi:mono/diheme cytochrome c family protein